MKYLFWTAGLAVSIVLLVSQLTDRNKKNKPYKGQMVSSSVINSFSDNKTVADWADEQENYDNVGESDGVWIEDEKQAVEITDNAPNNELQDANSVSNNTTDEENSEDDESEMYSYIFNDFYKTYKISPDGYSIHQDVVCKNGCFSDILNNCGVEYDKINALNKQAKRKKKVFDPKKIKPGKPYFVLCDTITQQAHYLIYEETPTEFLVFVLRSDQPDFYADTKPIEARMRTASGVVHASLYETMEANQIDPNLAIGLSKIFATSIDFFNI